MSRYDRQLESMIRYWVLAEEIKHAEEEQPNNSLLASNESYQGIARSNSIKKS